MKQWNNKLVAPSLSKPHELIYTPNIQKASSFLETSMGPILDLDIRNKFNHSWYSGVDPGGALNLRQHQTTLARFRTDHLKPSKIENNNKFYPTCPKCRLAPAAPEHNLACNRCSKQDLWERPLLIIKQLEEHELMEFVNHQKKIRFWYERKTVTSEDRYLVVTAKRHREMTAIQLSNELSSATGTRISRQTVYRRLHEGALYARRPMVCIPSTSAHRRARLNWCLEHHAWTHDHDESRFSLNTDYRRVFIWREPGTRYHLSNIREINSFRGGSLLVWAGISSSRRTPLHIFSGGTLTAQRYRDEILEPYLRPYRDQIDHNLIFMAIMLVRIGLG
ncbi:hypothetical protein LAZ67_3003937 [Cordylochernes scorpioides]|uniref:Transposase Tc1-like domain-containing protein n=1 Tax=Cordylochernes scorpioides TaxID=51811 RepID=A0ABY6K915_9ARAC|nr:hypothetical protein LAZ67_3003937 [Cordylochernes scorpioides]